MKNMHSILIVCLLSLLFFSSYSLHSTISHCFWLLLWATIIGVVKDVALSANGTILYSLLKGALSESCWVIENGLNDSSFSPNNF